MFAFSICHKNVSIAYSIIFYPGNTRESGGKISSIEQRGDGCCIQPGPPCWLSKSWESWICKSVIQVPGPDFSMYTRGNPSNLSQPSTNENVLENWNATKNAPVVWFVSHCKDYNGRWKEKSYVNPIFIRMKYVRWLQKFIGVHIYGDCGNYKCGKVFNVQLEIMLSCRTTTVIVSFLVTQPIPASKYEPGGLLHTPWPLLWDGQQKIQVKKTFYENSPKWPTSDMIT